MRKILLSILWGGAFSLVAAATHAQARPSIGYAYPAGGQQGTTFQVKLGGQKLDDATAVLVTGSGVTAKMVEYFRRMNAQEIQLLNEQLKELKKTPTPAAPAMMQMAPMTPMMTTDTQMTTAAPNSDKTPPAAKEPDEATRKLIARIEQRTREYVPTPACNSISSLAFIEVTIAPGAEPGERELRLSTPHGVSNPLVFHVGQLAEHTRKSMISANLQVLGKEAQALRKRPAEEVEDRVAIPCTLNGQIASGEVNRYRFEARRGQRLVISTQGRQLIPFIADAVPGWFQPVIALYDAKGKELAYCDDYRFKTDPVMFFDVSKDGDYVLEIRDSIYRGREDFVYRISIGELPFITGVFPLGAQADTRVTVKAEGLNLRPSDVPSPTVYSVPDLYRLAAHHKGTVSNFVPFAVDTLPECLEQECDVGGIISSLTSALMLRRSDKGRNDTPTQAQVVRLPLIINGRINRPDDWDVFTFTGKADDMVAAEVYARRLDSPLDSVLKLTDADGKLLAYNDDHENLEAGTNTHHADSYFMAKLPADGTYYLHIGDAARNGGDKYAYRLRISAPRPGSALRAAPSSITLRSKANAGVTVYAVRKDGFSGPITLSLKAPPQGFSAPPVTMASPQTTVWFNVKTDLTATKNPVDLVIVGSAKIGEEEITREAVPAEDRMQAFLWRHLVPASDLKAMVFDPNFQPPPKRVARERPATPTTSTATDSPTATTPAKPKFTK